MDDAAPQHHGDGSEEVSVGAQRSRRRAWTTAAALAAVLAVVVVLGLNSGSTDTTAGPAGSSSGGATAEPGPAAEAAGSDSETSNGQSTGTVAVPAPNSGDGDDARETGDACTRAFEAAAAVAAEEMEENLEEMRTAFTACGSFDEFATTESRFPDALYGVDPAVYAENQCRSEPSLSGAPVCRTLP